eukprot:4377727-Heterocapsa_arctica.AAC.1
MKADSNAPRDGKGSPSNSGLAKVGEQWEQGEGRKRGGAIGPAAGAAATDMGGPKAVRFRRPAGYPRRER